MQENNINPVNYWWKKYLNERLTIKDIHLIDDILSIISRKDKSKKQFYQEVLDEFNKQRMK